MSNSFQTIAQRMDSLQSQITATDAETKSYSDKAVASHAKRLDLERQLTETREELSGALGAITSFLGSLTVLPDLVITADEIFDQEAAANTASGTGPVETATPPATPAPKPPKPPKPAPIDSAADPLAAAAALGLPGGNTTPAPATPPPPVTPTPEPVVVEQPVTVPEPVVGTGTGLGLPGADTLNITPAPVSEPELPEAPEPAAEPEPSDFVAPSPVTDGVPVTESEPGDAEMVDEVATMPEMPVEEDGESTEITSPKSTSIMPDSTFGDTITVESSDETEEDAPEEEEEIFTEMEKDPLTGLPKPKI